ncbi:hypothetical protein BVG79_01817 [Ketogulonicigenium robustum]|uniref:DUF2125 domain-containing protein n=1 Tax=Ketogulonicigenium robustum TaxID=92947 RepID=A0A1W6P187_9RHOB|nr:DUF2125 domain-containing protein [Ketogulonicigenium robustum]ARO15161.1 hypothetical protein BVG79_01817 [Ketogulonicigenium robustum]
MRLVWMLVVVLTALALYCGYWFVGHAQLTQRIDALVKNLPAYGWQIDYDTLDTVGFPSRFDTTVTNLNLYNPAQDLGWQTPSFKVYAISYQPHKIVARWPQTQQITLFGQPIAVDSSSMMGSGRIGLSTDLPLEEATIDGRDLVLTSDFGWQARLDRLLVAMRTAPETEDGAAAPQTDLPVYDTYAGVQNLVLPAGIRAALDPQNTLPPAIAAIDIDLQVALAAPIDRHLTTMPPLDSVNLRRVHLQWGDVQLTATGTLHPDATGRAEGEVAVTLNGWRKLIDLAVAAGALLPERADQLAMLLGALGQGESLSLTLTVSQGVLRYGPIPLMPLPAILQPAR